MRAAWVVFAAFAASNGLPHLARAQGNQFGGQERADAAQQMIVLAVQQAISSLPPTSGQAFSFEYDLAKDTYVRSAVLGPTVLRSTRPIGKGKLSLRMAASYFDLSQAFGPITYEIEPRAPELAAPRGFAKLGLEAEAKVGVFNFAATYGITNRLDVSLVVPVTIVNASAYQTFSTRRTALDQPPRMAPLSAALTRGDLQAALDAGLLVYRKESFSDLGFDFNDGTHVGLSRISLGGRAVLYADERYRLAFAPEFFFPSPSESQFAGSDSAAILPRIIGEIAVTGPLRLLADAGYDYDFTEAELRRFTGSGGVLLAFSHFSMDFGLSGSVYDEPIEWTPSVAYGVGNDMFPPTIVVAQENNQLGADFLDFIWGVKVKLTDSLVLSGAVTVPVNSQGFRPAALGTIGVEAYL
jgi:hypothetical protein